MDTTSTFRGAKFNESANFYKTRFNADAQMKQVQFRGPAEFPRAVFVEQCFLEGSVFVKKATLSRVEFKRSALFGRVRFKEDCAFAQSEFHEAAVFSECKFNGNATFSDAHFFGRASFLDARFQGDADFSAIRSDVAFNLEGSRFLGRVPSFIESSFREKPRLDNVEVADPLALTQNWHAAAKDGLPSDPRPAASLSKYFFRRFKVAPNADIQARYRVLKALAIGSSDHIQEIDFFAQEMRARRFWFDQPKTTVFWLGLLYEKLSWFGRDILRPLIWWIILVFVVAALYFVGSYSARYDAERSSVSQTSKRDELDNAQLPYAARWSNMDCPAQTALKEGCEYIRVALSKIDLDISMIADPLADLWFAISGARCASVGLSTRRPIEAGPIWISIQFSLKNAFVLGGALATSANDKSAACLFGARRELSSVELSPALPAWVVIVAALESIIGTVLIFLSLLGVRNHFRIK